MSDRRYLSIFMDRFLPEYIRTTYPDFAKFIQYFLEYLESNGKVLYLIFDLLRYLDIDRIEEETIYDPYNGDDTVLEEYIAQFISSFPLYRIADIDIKKLIKNAKDFYSSKGTENSYDFLFRLMDRAGAFDFYYPGQHIMTLSDSDHMLDGESRIHDNYYAAYFTYEIQSTLYGYAELKDIIPMIHPAGCKCFFLRILETLTSLTPTLQDQDPWYVSFAFEFDSAYQWSNFDTYNLIYQAAAITFADIEAGGSYLTPLRGIGKMTFKDWGDTFDHLENSATNFDYFRHQLSVYTTLL